ncbi:hypothetical protein [Halostreptopolyspora alba]|uniref:hypothetical protein n=1 Tax=Halostreptopolyspora alba TaxID=2487137 RepID=UPI0011CE9437
MDTSVTVAGYVVLLLLGFVAGIVCSLLGGWLSWFWGTGVRGMLLAGVALVVFLASLYAGCRTAGWAMGSRLGAGLPALGWVAAGLTLTFVDGIQLLATTFSGVFHIATIVAVILATLLSDPPGPTSTPASRAGSSR